MQEKISAVIICRSEEKKIGPCLESVQWADEILVIDAFSADRTVEIARERNARVIQKEWTDYRRQREFAISLAEHGWILFLDADERVSPELREEISEVLASEAPAEGYDIPRRTYYHNNLLKHWGRSYTLRLFKKSAGKMDPGRDIHETVIITGRTSKLKNHIDHYTYDNIGDYIVRQNIYTGMLAQQLYDKHGNIPAPLLALKMLTEPGAEFLRKYLFHLGFLGGMSVFVMSVMSAVGKFVVYVKYWEIKQDRGKK